MEYMDRISDGITFIDNILRKLGRSPIFENNDVIIEEINAENYLRLRFDKRDERFLYFLMDIQLNGIEIHLSRIPEAFWFPNEKIKLNEDKVENFLIMLLTSEIKMENYEPNYTKAYFYDENGSCVHIIKRITGFYLKMKKNQEIIHYAPFYRD